ncbi:MAG: glycosyltransferase family 4 protein [Chloroflexi bacterium]|jgi:glycosyltransferase involved in cell wall biosynthesis|nr:glycosyltransferase family 4 protein [Chloroflexota bacterium]
MRVCLWGTFDPEHVRNRVIKTGLEQAGAEVVVCHRSLWRGRGERVRESARQRLNLSLIGRGLAAYWHLCWCLLTMARPDVVLVGYPGQIDALIARPICWLRRMPLVLDAFLSIYETAVTDRKLVPKRSWRARLLWCLERQSCRGADLVLLDTEADCAFFQNAYGVGRYARVWVGAPEPSVVAPARRSTGDDTFDVLFVGTFIPLHGIEHILRAAKLLATSAPEVRITFIGSGQMYTEMRLLAQGLALDNVEWGPSWLDEPELSERAARADLILGVFGTSAKAQRVIPAKAYAALAAGRPLVTADTPGSREALTHDETALLCPPGDPKALASAILAVRANRAEADQIAANGQALYWQRFAPRPIGELLLALLRPLVRRTSHFTAAPPESRRHRRSDRPQP